ncbi:hypothetical protein LOAG_01486 [Loa loa]|uniref:Protein sleepless n=1 Tax=Loa loa TaxID=7209 RepID=A0A1S0U8U5_LOALO|nr:hypothetical protein LOAG_01486 [Loa loa]EFO26990.2 hypothetical protein LOAG_01486 [Loa loa]
MVMQEVDSIGCFVCFSFNGSDPSCEDTFNSTILHKEPNRIVDDVSQTMVIRTCALDSGTFTADTEIVRISHCGHFKYKGHQYSGCVQSCDTDGCNGASGMGTHLYVPYVVLIIIIVFAALHYQILPDFIVISLEIVGQDRNHFEYPSNYDLLYTVTSFL